MHTLQKVLFEGWHTWSTSDVGAWCVMVKMSNVCINEQPASLTKHRTGYLRMSLWVEIKISSKERTKLVTQLYIVLLMTHIFSIKENIKSEQIVTTFGLVVKHKFYFEDAELTIFCQINSCRVDDAAGVI